MTTSSASESDSSDASYSDTSTDVLNFSYSTSETSQKSTDSVHGE